MPQIRALRYDHCEALNVRLLTEHHHEYSPTFLCKGLGIRKELPPPFANRDISYIAVGRKR